jgi:predicted nucleotidyltransferase
LVDFLPMPAAEKAHSFFEMREALHALLQRDIDLVMAGAVRNRIIAREIESSRQLIYGA